MSEASAVQGDGNEQGTDDEQPSLRLIRREDEVDEVDEGAVVGTVEGAPNGFVSEPMEEPEEIPEDAFGVLAVVTVPVQAEILLNDQSIGVAPLQVRVLPGQYAMKVRYLGRPLYECDVTIVEGQSTSVPLDFSEPPPTQAPASRPAPPRVPKKRSPLFGYGTLGLLGVAVTIGGIIAMRSSSDEEEPEPRSELPPSPPPQTIRRRRRRRFGEVPPEAEQAPTPPASPPATPTDAGK